jgi:UbiD family decarboxylase
MRAKKKVLRCTRDFIDLLKSEQQLWQIDDPVDPNLELAQIQREVSSRQGPAILFTNVIGTRFPVATNLYGSGNRLELAFGSEPIKFIEELADTALNIIPPNAKKIWKARRLGLQGIKIGLKTRSHGAVLKNRFSNLGELPQIKSWPEDGGAFITLPLVYTESPVTGKGNLGMYRIQLFDDKTAGVHIQIHRGGGFHYHEAEQLNQSLPVRIFIGGPPALTIAAIAPLPEDIPELLFASLLMGEKLKVARPAPSSLRLVLESDFSLQGLIPPQHRKTEGPFGDHYGYYSLQHPYPYLEIESVNYRERAIFPATIVGRPPQEDHYIAEFLQDILKPLFPLVMSNVRQVWAYEESGVHSLAGVIVKNRYHKEAFTAALRVLSEGHLSLTKCLVVTDQDCHLKDFRELLIKVLERINFKTDLYLLAHISQDTLDYSHPIPNEGSKVILLGIGKKIRELKKVWSGNLINSALGTVRMFCPGVVCVEGSPYHLNPDLAEELVKEEAIQAYPLVLLVDDSKEATKTTPDFIWHIFTRFDPHADMYGKKIVTGLHVGVAGSLVIDCRMKPWYPAVLEDDPKVAERVQDKWGEMIDRVCRT